MRPATQNSEVNGVGCLQCKLIYIYMERHHANRPLDSFPAKFTCLFTQTINLERFKHRFAGHILSHFMSLDNGHIGGDKMAAMKAPKGGLWEGENL